VQCGADAHAASRRRELDGVANQVFKHLKKSVAITQELGKPVPTSSTSSISEAGEFTCAAILMMDVLGQTKLFQIESGALSASVNEPAASVAGVSRPYCHMRHAVARRTAAISP
jgi:hypothetical protein